MCIFIWYYFYLVGKRSHKQNEASTSTSAEASHLFRQASSGNEEVHPSIKAEVNMAMMIVDHNTFSNLSDHFTPYVRQEIHGSAAAAGFQCSRTKTAAMVNCIGKSLKDELVQDLKSTPFSFMVDGRNDVGLFKMFQITVRVFEINRIMTNFLDINLLSGRDSSKAQAMFDSINDKLEGFGLSWDFVTGIGVHNSNANIGIRNSIKS